MLTQYKHVDFHVRTSSPSTHKDAGGNKSPSVTLPSIFRKTPGGGPSSPSQQTLSTCSSWASSISPSSLALRSSLSIWPSFSRTFSKDSDDTAAAKPLSAKNNDTDSVPNDTVTTTKKTAPVDPPTTHTNLSTVMRQRAKMELYEAKMLLDITSTDSMMEAELQLHSPSSSSNPSPLLSHDDGPTPSKNNITASRELTNNRKKWIEETLLDTKSQSYSTTARDEMCKDQNNNEVTSQRKKWIESTLLTPNKKDAKRAQQKKLPELQQLPSSVSKRREWLADVSNVKCAHELEEEVRKEQLEAARLKKQAKEEEEEALRKLQEEKERDERVAREAHEVAAKYMLDAFARSVDDRIQKAKLQEEKDERATGVRESFILEVEKEERAARVREIFTREVEERIQKAAENAVRHDQASSIHASREEIFSSMSSEEEDDGSRRVVVVKKEQPAKDAAPAKPQPVKKASYKLTKALTVSLKHSRNEEVVTDLPKKKKKKTMGIKKLVKRVTKKMRK